MQDMWVQSLGREDRSFGIGADNVLLSEYPMYRGAWWAKILEVAKNWTWLSGWTHTQSQIVWWEFCVSSHSVVSDSFATIWTLAHQASLSMGFFRHNYWSGLPVPTPEGVKWFCLLLSINTTVGFSVCMFDIFKIVTLTSDPLSLFI